MNISSFSREFLCGQIAALVFVKSFGKAFLLSDASLRVKAMSRLLTQDFVVRTSRQFLKTAKLATSRSTLLYGDVGYYCLQSKTSRTNQQLFSFSRTGANIWNGIPLKVRELEKASFKLKLKRMLLQILQTGEMNVDMRYLNLSKYAVS